MHVYVTLIAVNFSKCLVCDQVLLLTRPILANKSLSSDIVCRLLLFD